MIIYAGDIHGRVDALVNLDEVATRHAVHAVVQCGDFGIFWPHTQGAVANYFHRRARKGKHVKPWFFCDGNHDVHDRLDKLRRGGRVTIAGVKHTFCGGARSTDRGPDSAFYAGKRIWWPQEAPSRSDLEIFFESFDTFKPDVVVTHEAPACVPLRRSGRESDATVRGFQSVLDVSAHRPAAWFFGHHHDLETWEVNDTKFACAGWHGEHWIRVPESGTLVRSLSAQRMF
jgi:Icc-related predicted phosphoesterase